MKTETNGTVSTLARGLKLIQVLTEAPAPISLARLARVTGFDASTCHRMLQTLTTEGWAVQDEQTREYAAGPHALVRCAPWHPLSLFKQQARAQLERLNERTKETVCLIAFTSIERVIVDVIHGQLTLSSYYDIRLTTPLHGSASGKVLLSGMPPAQRDTLLGPGPYPATTPFTVTEPKKLAGQLNEISKNGFVISRDESFVGLVAYGAPITYRGHTLGCVVITCSSDGEHVLDDERLGRECKEASELISSVVPSIHQLSHFLSGV
ncbi:MAG: IclR family transcriptional regulator [Burkholderiaceae bacterium]|nr:IclR family transcriptional regulator [Burkholderiaceae bacterium]